MKKDYVLFFISCLVIIGTIVVTQNIKAEASFIKGIEIILAIFNALFMFLFHY